MSRTRRRTRTSSTRLDDDGAVHGSNDDGAGFEAGKTVDE
jgi:hypothetical protein